MIRIASCRTIAVLGLTAVAAILTLPVGAATWDGVLDNGMRVILIENRASPMVSSSVIVGAGAIHEPDGMNGASHFLEHLLFNGTTTRTQRELYDEVDLYGAYNNATTREDHTLFSLLIQKEFFAAGLEIQADMLFRSTLPPDKFEKEKGIVLEELARDRGNPDYLAGLAFREFAFAGTPVARSVLGTEDSITALKRDDVWQYYKSLYVPGNMTLVVLGDFEIAAMKETVKRIFGAAAARPMPRRPSGEWPAPPEHNARTVPLDAGRVYVHAAIPLGFPAHDRRTTALELLVTALADGSDSPLGRALKGDAGLGVQDYNLGVMTRGETWSTLEFSAHLESGEAIPKVLEIAAGHLADLGAGSEARSRVPRVRARARNDEILLADRIHYVAMMRSSYLHGSPPYYATRRIEILDSIRNEELDDAATLVRHRLGEIRVVAAGAGFDDGAKAWKPTLPQPGPVDRATALSRTLANGLEVAFDRNDDSRVFAVHVLFRLRASMEPDGKAGITDVLCRVFDRGSERLDAAALAARLDRLGAEIKTHDEGRIPYDDYYTDPDYAFVRFEMPAEGWREGVALLAELLRSPRVTPEALDEARLEVLDVQERRARSARAAANSALWEMLAPGHPGMDAVYGTANSVGSITLEDLEAHHGRLLTGRRMIVTGVGPVAPAAFLETVESSFGDLPEGPELPAIEPAPLSGEPRREDLPGEHEQARIVLGYLFDAADDDRAALAVAAAMLSDRMTFQVRESEGLAYSIGCSTYPAAGRTMFRIGLGTRPENVDRALQAVRDSMQEARGGLAADPTAVRRAANAIRGRMLMRRLTRINQAYFLGLDVMSGRPPGAGLGKLDDLLAVGSEDVERVLPFLKVERCSAVVAR